MKKEMFVVVVDNYFPELCKITLPYLEKYANRIGAKFTIISERKFKEFPTSYEKLQVYELGKDNDCNILLDCDMLITEKMYDVTQHINMNGTAIGVWTDYSAKEFSFLDYKYDRIIVTNFMVVPKRCHDVWKPVDCKFEDIKYKLEKPFNVDEYVISKNLFDNGFTRDGIIINTKEDHGKLFYHINLTTDSINVNEKLLTIYKAFLNSN